MADGLKEIISRLEQQKTAIERALAALREVEGVVPAAAAASRPASVTKTKARRKGGMTPEGRKRLSEALRQRWAAKRAGEPEPAAMPKKRGRKPKAV